MKVVTIQFSPLSAVLAATWSPGTTCRRRWWLRHARVSSMRSTSDQARAHAPRRGVLVRARRAILRRRRRLVLRLRLHLPQVWRIHPTASVVCVRLRMDVRVRHAVRSRAAHVRALHLRVRRRVSGEPAARRWRQHGKAAHAPLPPAPGRSAALVRPQPRLPPRELALAARQRMPPDPCPACGCSPRPASEGAVHSAGSPRAACGRLRGRARTRSPAVAARRTFSVDSCCMSCDAPKNPQPKVRGPARPLASAAHLVRLFDLAAQPRNQRSLLRRGLPVGQGRHLHALLIFRLRRVPQLCAARCRSQQAHEERRASASRHAPVMRSSSSRSVDSKR